MQQQQHPGKINLGDFTNVTDAIARMKLASGAGSKDSNCCGSGQPPPTHAPPPPPPRLAKVRGSVQQFRLPTTFQSIAPLATPETEDFDLDTSRSSAAHQVTFTDPDPAATVIRVTFFFFLPKTIPTSGIPSGNCVIIIVFVPCRGFDCFQTVSL